MGRKPCCSKEEGLNRGAWTAAEDKILTDYITIYGEGKWRYLPKRAGLKRCGKSCRLRWLNYLRPDIKRGNISRDEEELIIRLHNLLGNRWSLIAGRLPGRTDNEIKNYWNTNIRKKLQDHHQSPSSSTACTLKTLNQCQEKPKFGSKKFITNTDSCPIRTRASKCTKVLIFSSPEQEKCYGQDQVIVGPAPSTANGPVDDDNGQNVMNRGGTVLPEFNVEENEASDFLIDFEMDERFLSLLDTDLSQLLNLDDTNNIGGDVVSISNTCGKDQGYYSSENSDDKVKDSEFVSIDELIRSEFQVV